jgi:CubicO group peptidase (beta-lactamase class C family)
LYALLILAFTGALNPNENAADAIDSLMSTYHSQHEFNGSVLVAKSGQVIYQKGFGYANLTTEQLNTPQTRFRLASLTKQFTAVLVLKLVDQGKLQLDDVITDHLPEFRQDTGSKITLHQLLQHTSGIPSYGRNKTYMRNQAHQPVQVAEFIQTHCSGDLDFEPGTQARYSNSGYFLLGAIIEKVTGMPFGEAIEVHLLKPLNLQQTGYDDGSHSSENHALGYRQIGGKLESAKTINVSVAFAAGGLYSTVADLYKWDRALYSGQLLPANILQQMLTPNQAHFGYGVRTGKVPLENHEQKTFVAHGGGLFGFSHYMMRIMEDDHLIVMLCNGGRRPFQAEQNILKILYDLPVEQPKPSAVDAALELVQQGELEKALKKMRKLKRKGHHRFDLKDFDRMGTLLLDQGDHPFAINLYTLQTMVVPNSGMAHQDLGKAHLVAQNISAAIASFKQAVTLDPQCDDALRFLNYMGIDIPKPPKDEGLPSSEQLADYVGEYQMSRQRKLRVFFEGDQFMAQPEGKRAVALVATSPTHFQVRNQPAQLEFLLNDDKQVVAVVLHQRGRKHRGERR